MCPLGRVLEHPKHPKHASPPQDMKVLSEFFLKDSTFIGGEAPTQGPTQWKRWKGKAGRVDFVRFPAPQRPTGSYAGF